MNTPQSVFNLAETISNASSQVYGLKRSGDARWWEHALSDIAVILGDAPVVLADFHLDWHDGPDNEYDGTITVISDSLVITTDVTNGASKSATRNTTARHRSDLKALQVTAGTPAFDPAMGSQWPGKVTATLTYTDRTITLPAERSEPRQYGILTNFLPALAADLA